ncbi:MAG: UspA domain protein [Bryobacterales bacterium]|jgi:nucleotide-binding universal stress UspA family protein|nr:UspA domain protein [Bryobacterales bacterium]
MLAIKHILFPIDFSERCCHAAPFVQAMARRFGAKITLISALPPIWQLGIGEGTTIPVDMDELKRDLETRLSGAFVREFDGIQVQRIAEVGDPAAVITRFAQNEGADLIMMPTHGYGPFRSLLLGSVTAKVLHDAECPVWTATHMEGPLSLRQRSGGNLLCAVDGTPKSVPLMEWAAEYARFTGAKLRMVHAVSGFVGWPERQLDQEFQEALRKDAREAIDRLQRSIGVTTPLCVGVGDVAGVVRAEAERHDSDLILIGRGILHETMGRLRTHSYGIIRQAPCPVLSV